MKLLILNLPNPQKRNVIRDAAGGFGIAVPLHPLRSKHSGKPYFNPFLPYAASVAEDYDCDYEIIDAQSKILSKKGILGVVKNIDPDVVISMISLPSIYEDLAILNIIKEELINPLIIGCGSVCNFIPEEVLKGGGIDLVTRDVFPYVNSLEYLLSHYEKKDKSKIPGFSYKDDTVIKTNPIKPPNKRFEEYEPNYDKLHLSSYGHFYNSEGKKQPLIPIIGSKGCNYPCSYCPYPIGFGCDVSYKDPNKVVDEIEKITQKGFNYFLFRDQSFTTHKKWSETVCNAIIDRNLEISWICEARVDESTENILKLMLRSGCEKIHYGVESGDPTHINVAKPGLHLQKTKDTFKRSKELGLWRHAHMLFGLPGENSETLKASKKFLFELKPDGISINFATPYPGTKLYEIAQKNNWILTHNWEYYSSFDVVMSPPGMTPEDLYDAAQDIQISFLRQKNDQLLLKGFNIGVMKQYTYNKIQTILTQLSYKKRYRRNRMDINEKMM